MKGEDKDKRGEKKQIKIVKLLPIQEKILEWKGELGKVYVKFNETSKQSFLGSRR